MPKVPVEIVVKDLVACAVKLSDSECLETWHKFHVNLKAIFKLPPDIHEAALKKAFNKLVERGSFDAYEWLLNELEVEASLVEFEDDRGEQSCVLFCIPLIFNVADSYQKFVRDDESFELLHDVLVEADIVSSQAEFRLVPRLFSHQELAGLTHLEVRALTEALSQQLTLESDNINVPAIADRKPSLIEDYKLGELFPNVTCQYLIGVAQISSDSLDELFPSLAYEVEDTSPGFAVYDEDGTANGFLNAPDTTVGKMEDGSPWEDAFLMGVSQTFGALNGPLSVLPPDGFFSDLFRGKAEAREHNLATAVRRHSLDDLYVELSAIRETGEDLVVLTVTLLARKTGVVLDELSWPLLDGEETEAALADLHSVLEELQVTPSAAHRGDSSNIGGLLLH